MNELPLNQVVVGDCTEVMQTWPADSIDLVVTSPPYWGLRDYGLGEDQLGLESHPQLFIDHLVDICRDIRRVLKPSGTFWLNIGDTYYGSVKVAGGDDSAKSKWIQPKQKLMMPARVAIALQHDGWILRNDLIWFKPNHMPSSVKDRLTSAYEHVFLFAKARRYYFDLDAIRKPFSEGTFLRIRQPNIDNQPGGPKTVALRGDKPRSGNASRPIDMAQELSRKIASGEITGKNPGDVWTIPTTPFPGAHFATFPTKLIKPIIKAGSPRWICSRCGKPRIRITEPTPAYAKKLGKSVHDHKDDLKRGMRYDKVYNAEYMTTGWSDCGCNAGWTPGVVLDPFAGSGTVGQVAHRLGRRFILIEIKSEYAEMAERRIRGQVKPIPKGVVQLTQIMEADK